MQKMQLLLIVCTNKTPPCEQMFRRKIRSKLDTLLSTNGVVRNDFFVKIKTKFFVKDRAMIRAYNYTENWKLSATNDVLSPLHYLVKLDNSRVQKRHVDQIRTEFTKNDAL